MSDFSGTPLQGVMTVHEMPFRPEDEELYERLTVSFNDRATSGQVKIHLPLLARLLAVEDFAHTSLILQQASGAEGFHINTIGGRQTVLVHGGVPVMAAAGYKGVDFSKQLLHGLHTELVEPEDRYPGWDVKPRRSPFGINNRLNDTLAERRAELRDEYYLGKLPDEFNMPQRAEALRWGSFLLGVMPDAYDLGTRMTA